jgi:hypothetical protein
MTGDPVLGLRAKVSMGFGYTGGIRNIEEQTGRRLADGHAMGESATCSRRTLMPSRSHYIDCVEHPSARRWPPLTVSGLAT